MDCLLHVKKLLKAYKIPDTLEECVIWWKNTHTISVSEPFTLLAKIIVSLKDFILTSPPELQVLAARFESDSKWTNITPALSYQ